MTGKRATMAGVMLAMTLAFGQVRAQEPKASGLPDAASQREATGGERTGLTQRKPTKVIEMDTLEVIGKVQKPRVYYVIGRGKLEYHLIPLERDLLKEVEKTLEGGPF